MSTRWNNQSYNDNCRLFQHLNTAAYKPLTPRWSRNLKAVCLRGFKPVIVWNTRSIDHIRLENLAGDAIFLTLSGIAKEPIENSHASVYHTGVLQQDAMCKPCKSCNDAMSECAPLLDTDCLMKPTNIISYPSRSDLFPLPPVNWTTGSIQVCRHRRWSIMAEDRKSTHERSLRGVRVSPSLHGSSVSHFCFA